MKIRILLTFEGEVDGELLPNQEEEMVCGMIAEIYNCLPGVFIFADERDYAFPVDSVEATHVIDGDAE